MHKYRLVAKKGEGTFSEVLKAQSVKNGKCFAIKCMKNHFDSIEQVNNLREIQALRRLSPCPHIVKLYEVLFDQPTGRLALVFELMSMNIYELIRGRRHYVPEETVLHYMFQLAKALDHMHRHGIFHRDIKPENILIVDNLLKLADFGSCRGIYSKQPYTEYISTRWYRAPECLLTDGYYGYKMDLWGVGSVMFEIIALYPLFPGTNEVDQVQKIHHVLGTPPKEILQKFWRYRSSHIDFNFPEQKGLGIPSMIPHASPEAINLIQKLLAYDPEERISARQTLHHPYFRPLLEMEKERKHNMQGHGHSHMHEAKVAPHPQPAAATSDSKSKQKTQSNPRAAAKGADDQQGHMHAGGTGKAAYGAAQTGMKDNSLPHISKTQEQSSKSISMGELQQAVNKPKKKKNINRTIPLEEEYLPPIANSLHNLKIDMRDSNASKASTNTNANVNTTNANASGGTGSVSHNRSYGQNNGKLHNKLGQSHRRRHRRQARDKEYDTGSYLQVSSILSKKKDGY